MHHRDGNPFNQHRDNTAVMDKSKNRSIKDNVQGVKEYKLRKAIRERVQELLVRKKLNPMTELSPETMKSYVSKADKSKTGTYASGKEATRKALKRNRKVNQAKQKLSNEADDLGGTNIKCPICGAHFSSQSDYKKHREYKHDTKQHQNW